MPTINKDHSTNLYNGTTKGPIQSGEGSSSTLAPISNRQQIDNPFFNGAPLVHLSNKGDRDMEIFPFMNNMELEMVDVTVFKIGNGLNPNKHLIVLFKETQVHMGDVQVVANLGNISKIQNKGRERKEGGTSLVMQEIQ